MSNQLCWATLLSCLVWLEMGLGCIKQIFQASLTRNTIFRWIYRFAALDVQGILYVEGVRRQRMWRKALLTAYVHSDDEYFDKEVTTVAAYPFTYLDDCARVGSQITRAVSLYFLRSRSSSSSSRTDNLANARLFETTTAKHVWQWNVSSPTTTSKHV